MHEDQQNQSQSATENVKGAIKTGKAISNIARGAAAGGMTGAAFEAVRSSKKFLLGVAALFFLPVVIIAMLPSLIFGSLLGDGSETPNGFTDGSALTQNMTDLNTQISTVLSEGLTDVLNRIDDDFTTSGCDEKEINNPYGADVVFNANRFISMYCAAKDQDVESISKADLDRLLRAHKDKLYSFTSKDETRTVTVGVSEPGDDNSAEKTEEKTITVRIYQILYNGEAYFETEIFNLSDEQKTKSDQYAQNMSLLFSDGIYQVIPGSDYTDLGVSYDGIVFTDGATQVTYYNQLDGRWCNAPYGTDNIGGYACGPTSMAIVISSLTSETVDPIQMSKWAYENGYWCSKSGSYHTLIPGAAKAWNLPVTGCTKNEPQRIVDALSDGKLVVALMTKGHFTSGGHFIVLRGVSNGKILVADPASYKRSNMEWDLSIIMNEASARAGAGGPFWIIGT